MEIEKDTDLPRNLVKKIVKNKVSQVQASTGAQQGRDVQVNRDALLAFSESAKVFISYLTSAANDICKDAKRQTISAEDVFTALQDLDFGELINPTKDALEAFRQESKEKNKRKAEQAKKRKAEEAVRQHAQDGPEDPAAEPAAAEHAASDFGHQPAYLAQPAQQQPYIAQAHPAYQKQPEPALVQPAQQQAPTAANTFQQAFSQAGLPFNQAIGQQAAQFAAALAQAQQASQLLPQQFNPSQLPIQFPAAQIPQGFPLAGQINQANYAQFAAVLAQQAARQRQAQELAAQQAQRVQQVQQHPGIVQQAYQNLQQQQQQRQQQNLQLEAPSSTPQPAEQATTRESNMQGDGQAQAFQ